MTEEKLRLIPDRIQRFLKHIGWSPGDFAVALDIELEDSYKLLSGEPVAYLVAKQFIYYFRAPLAKEFIDWDTMDIKPPRLKNTYKSLADDVLFSILSQQISDLEKEKKLNEKYGSNSHAKTVRCGVYCEARNAYGKRKKSLPQ